MKILDVPQSGSVAGQTSSRNRYGQYRRTRANPVQPNSPAQVAARAELQSYAEGWRALDGEEQDSWRAYGETVTRYDSLGQAYTLTGLQAYIGAQTLRNQQGETETQSVPSGSAETGPPTATTLAIDDTPTLTVTCTGLTASANTSCAIYASPPVSAGRAWNGDYRFIKKTTPTALGTGTTCATEYAAKFGAISPGVRIFVRVAHVKNGIVWWKVEANDVASAA